LVPKPIEEVTMFHTRFLFAAMVTGFNLLVLSPCAVIAADGKLMGKVEVYDKPLASGRIIFYLGNGQLVRTRVKNGDYTINRLPVGTHKITIEGKGVPAKYAAETTTDLMMEVKEGSHIYNIILQP
jgi:hypothetical protein